MSRVIELRPELGVARHDLELLDVDRGEHVVAHDPLRDQDRVLEVVAVPGHERDQHVPAQSELAEVGRGSIRHDVAGDHPVADLHHRPLVDAGVLVRALELAQVVDVDHGIGALGLVGDPDHDPGRVDLIDHPAAARHDRRAGIAGHHRLHAGADQGRLALDQRHRLALHVGAHQRPVGVVVLEERDQRRRHRDQLLGRDVDELDRLRAREHEVAVLAAADQIQDEAPVLRQLGVGLGDRVAALLHRREVDHLVADLAVDDPPVGALDEAILVDPGVGREAVDQADVRPLRGLDRADPAIVGRMHVAHLEARPLAGQATRAQRRETPLVGDLRERIGLIHELRELRGAEELAHRRRHGLGVDQIVRHRGVDLDRAHALAHRPLHAQEADPELVLHQLADRAHPAIAEVVDVVDLAAAVLDLDQMLDHREDVLAAQHPDRVVGVELQARVHLDPADRRQVVALAVEEQAVEQVLGGIQVGRLARAQDAVDVEQRILAVVAALGRERVAHVRPDRDVVDVEHRQVLDLGLDQLGQQLGRQLGAGLGEHQAGLLVDQVLGDVAPDQLLGRHVELGQPLLAQALDQPRRQLGAGLRQHVAGLGVDQIGRELLAAQALGAERLLPALAAAREQQGVVKVAEDLLLAQPERQQQRGRRQLPPPVDPHVNQVLGVEFEVEPRAAIGDDPRREQELARAVGLALVVIVEHARRAVHLRDDHALGAVDHEGAVVGHQRQVAHVDVLLLDVADAARAGVVVDVPDDQAQGDPERGGEGHAALMALLDVVFRLLELVLDEVERRPLGEVPDREHRLEDLLQPDQVALRRAQVHLQEVLVGRALNLDQVRHHRDLGDVPEALADALAARERMCHGWSSSDAMGATATAAATGGRVRPAAGARAKGFMPPGIDPGWSRESVPCPARGSNCARGRPLARRRAGCARAGADGSQTVRISVT